MVWGLAAVVGCGVEVAGCFQGARWFVVVGAAGGVGSLGVAVGGGRRGWRGRWFGWALGCAVVSWLRGRGVFGLGGMGLGGRVGAGVGGGGLAGGWFRGWRGLFAVAANHTGELLRRGCLGRRGRGLILGLAASESGAGWRGAALAASVRRRGRWKGRAQLVALRLVWRIGFWIVGRNPVRDPQSAGDLPAGRRWGILYVRG